MASHFLEIKKVFDSKIKIDIIEIKMRLILILKIVN